MSSPTILSLDTYYHIYNRGNNRENIFQEDRNYWHFLKLYLHHIEPIAQTFAYCLLRNHFHLLVKIKTEDEIRLLSNAIKKEIITYPSQKFGDFLMPMPSRSTNLMAGQAVCFNILLVGWQFLKTVNFSAFYLIYTRIRRSTIL